MNRSARVRLRVLLVVSIVLVMLLSAASGLAQDTGTIAVDPAAVDFGDAVINLQTASLVISITNSGSADLTLLNMQIVGADAADFELQQAFWPVTLAPGEGQNVSLGFSPTSLGEKSAALQIDSDAQNETTTSVPLSGVGVGLETLGTVSASAVPLAETPLPGQSITVAIKIDMTQASAPADLLFGYQATLSWDPAVLAYSSYQFGDSPWWFPSTINRNAVTAGTVEWSDFAFQGDGGTFTVIKFVFNVVGTPNSSTVLDLEFSRFEGAQVVSLLPILTVNDGIIRQVIGSTSPPDINVVPAYHDYGTVAVNSTASQTFVVTNEGQQELKVSSSSLWGFGADRFSVDSGGAPFTLAAGESHEMVVSYNPTTTGSRTIRLLLRSNDPDESRFSVTLRGTASWPDIEVAPASLDFGALPVGSQTTQSLTLSNVGDAPLSISLYEMQEDGSAFAYAFDTLQVTFLNPGESIGISIRFNPTTAGAKTATFMIYSNDPDEAILEISLTGSGV